jgi:hypothetical protein
VKSYAWHPLVCLTSSTFTLECSCLQLCHKWLATPWQAILIAQSVEQIVTWSQGVDARGGSASLSLQHAGLPNRGAWKQASAAHSLQECHCASNPRAHELFHGPIPPRLLQGMHVLNAPRALSVVDCASDHCCSWQRHRLLMICPGRTQQRCAITCGCYATHTHVLKPWTGYIFGVSR